MVLYTQNETELNKLKFESEYFQTQIKQMRTAAYERSAELEVVYQDNDGLKTRLADLNMKYDFEAIDKSEKTLARIEDWAFKAKNWIFGLIGDLKQQFKCRLCHDSAQNLTTIKCGHVFCWECIRK